VLPAVLAVSRPEEGDRGISGEGALTGPAVVTRGLTKRFGSLVAVDHLDLTVKSGELYGFLGPNGAGKSTTLRMLTGIMEPTEGEGVVLGIDLRHDPERVKSAIGYMSQRFSLYDDLTVDENLTFYARVYMVPRGERGDRIQQMIRLAGLGGRERQLAGHLSGGFRQRLALVCALVHRPRLVFLDEPTAGVDPVSRRTFWALIRRLADEGTTVLVTTHYMDEAELCDSLGFIYQGRLIAAGSPERIKKDTFGRAVIELEVGTLRAAADVLAEVDAVEEVVRVGGRLRLIVAPGGPDADGVRRLLADRGFSVTWAREVEPSVEDLFVSFVDKERKTRVRDQLRALDHSTSGGASHGPSNEGGDASPRTPPAPRPPTVSK
jgi:ABC-2 type transport system ATP-binding protein